MIKGFNPASISLDSQAKVSIENPEVQTLVRRLASAQIDGIGDMTGPPIIPPTKGNPGCNGGCQNTTDCSKTNNVGCTNYYICFAP
jgi:hypothetical protein